MPRECEQNGSYDGKDRRVKAQDPEETNDDCENFDLYEEVASDNEEENENYSVDPEIDHRDFSYGSSDYSQNSPKRQKLDATTDKDNPQNSIEDVCEEEYKAIGDNVAFKLRRMRVDQRYYAELLINKVLINGLKDQLIDETDVVGLTQFVHLQ